MKGKILIPAIILNLLFFSSCKNENELGYSQVRIKNLTGDALYSAYFGDVYFGIINRSTVTEYKEIESGYQDFSSSEFYDEEEYYLDNGFSYTLEVSEVNGDYSTLLYEDGEVEIVYYHAAFTVNGFYKDFTTPLCLERDGSQYSASFNVTGDPYNGKFKNSLFIALPVSVIPGASYTNSNYSGDTGFDCFYFDENENMYMLGSSNLFNLTVTRWEGAGKTTAGYFSGKLYRFGVESTSYEIVISNGSFSIEICD